jgi:dynein light chain 4
MAEEEKDESNSLEQLKRNMQYALIKNCDMNEEMRSDAVDLVISATEKYQSNYELAARMIKEAMDKKYNENWIVAIGQGFAFEVTHEVKHVLWMYFCDIAVLVCKAGARQVGT